MLALNSQVMDDFVVAFSRAVRIPQTEILRLDLPASVCIEGVLRSRAKILEDLAKTDSSMGMSCAVALNVLRRSFPSRTEVIDIVSELGPLEFSQDTDKRIPCLTEFWEVVCHSVHETIRFNGQ